MILILHNEEFMDIQRLISFLGHTSNSDEFMDFLSDHGIRKKPKGDSVIRVRSADKKISLEFDLTESYLEDNPRQAVGSGWFTFSSVDVYPGAQADLPFGLSFDLSKSKLDALLGNSFDDAEDQVHEYRKAGYLIIVFFNKSKSVVDIYRFKQPNKYDIENMNIQS